MRARWYLPIIAVIAAFGGGGCSSEAGRWLVDDIDDPGALLESVEAKWHDDVEYRGSILHPAARCYFQLDEGLREDDVLETEIMCGPVSHWPGMVGPQPTPTAHEPRGGHWVPQFAPKTFRAPMAGSTKWDTYRFDSIHHLEDNSSKVTATGPMASFHGRKVPHPDEVALFWRPDHLTPPDDMGETLPTPTPPPDAVIPLDTVIDVDVDEQYRPGTYVNGNLVVTYDLDVTGGSWQSIELDGTRVLTLHIEADIEVNDGYRLNYDPSDSATADPDNGDEVSSITEGAVTSYEIDPDPDSNEHPDPVFHLPADAREATIELKPDVQFTATDDDRDLYPRAGLLDLPTERFTVRLVTDEQADAAAPK